MGAHAGRVDGHELGIGIERQSAENACKHATFAPSPEAPVGRFPVAVACRQVAPGDAGPVPIDDRIDEQAVVRRCATDVTFAARQEVLDLGPLVVAQGVESEKK